MADLNAIEFVREINHGRNGYRKSPGRKSNASKLLEAEFVASWFTPEFQEIKWKSFLESEDVVNGCGFWFR
jgi:hypothetical protein